MTPIVSCWRSGSKSVRRSAAWRGSMAHLKQVSVQIRIRFSALTSVSRLVIINNSSASAKLSIVADVELRSMWLPLVAQAVATRSWCSDAMKTRDRLQNYVSAYSKSLLSEPQRFLKGQIQGSLWYHIYPRGIHVNSYSTALTVPQKFKLVD